MKQGAGISPALAAMLSAVATIGCCLPLGFVAAIGAAGASAFLQRLRPWLLVISVASLGVGFWQQRRARQCSVKGSVLGSVFLWIAVGVVIAMIFFPQQIAGFFADHLSGSYK